MSQSEISHSNVAVWFEIPAADFERAVNFYQTVLQIKLREEMMGPLRMAVFPHAGEAVSGAIVQGGDFRPGATGSVVYLNAGDDLARPLARVAATGGKTVVPKTLITEEIGYFAHILDSEGNRVGLHSLK